LALQRTVGTMVGAAIRAASLKLDLKPM